MERGYGSRILYHPEASGGGGNAEPESNYEQSEGDRLNELGEALRRHRAEIDSDPAKQAAENQLMIDIRRRADEGKPRKKYPHHWGAPASRSDRTRYQG